MALVEVFADRAALVERAAVVQDEQGDDAVGIAFQVLRRVMFLLRQFDEDAFQLESLPARQSRTRREALDLQAWCRTSILVSSGLYRRLTLARLAGKQHRNVDRDVHRCRDVERRCCDVTGVRSHQHRMTNALAVETEVVHEPTGRRWPDPPLHRLGVVVGLAGMLLHETEAIDELGKAMGPG